MDGDPWQYTRPAGWGAWKGVASAQTFYPWYWYVIASSCIGRLAGSGTVSNNLYPKDMLMSLKQPLPSHSP